MKCLCTGIFQRWRYDVDYVMEAVSIVTKRKDEVAQDEFCLKQLILPAYSQLAV